MVQMMMDFLLNIIPKTIVGAFAEGEILQVLFISVLFGIAMAALAMPIDESSWRLNRFPGADGDDRYDHQARAVGGVWRG